MSGWMFPLSKLLQRRKAEASLDAEIEYHIEREAAENVRRGMTPEAALRKARADFGAVAAAEEECRESWGLVALEHIWRDVAYGLRSLRKDVVYTVAAVLTLALGIGSNTALYSVLRGVVLQPLPVRDGERVVLLNRVDVKSRETAVGFSLLETERIRNESKALEEVAEFHTMSFILLSSGEPRKVDTAVVGANYFDFFGLKPLHGRAFLRGEDQHGADGVLVLSHRYFQQAFGGDPKVVGTTVRLNDGVHTIVGVMPPFPEFPAHIDVYMPTSSCPTRSSAAFASNPRMTLIRLFGRLKAGATVEQAQAEFETITARFRTDYPEAYSAARPSVARVVSFREEVTRAARPTFLVLFAITGLVLLIACSSVANLSLARSLRREREVAIRSAIGGSRGRLVQQFLMEGLLVSLAGGAAGIGSAYAVLGMLRQFAARFSIRAGEIQMDMPVLAFSLAVSVATGLLFCGIPAWRTRMDAASVLKDRSAGSGAAGAGYTRRLLVGAQVAFSVLVLVSAGLLLRSFVRLSAVPLGFEPDQVLSLQVSSNANGRETYLRNMRLVLERARRIPGVDSAALTGRTPLAEGFNMNLGMVLEGEAEPAAGGGNVVGFSSASPQYFDTLKIPITRGRAIEERDEQSGAPAVAVVNETMARRRWPGGDAIGRRIRIAGGQSDWITVVGVCGDTRSFRLEQEAGEQVYLPLSALVMASQLLVRTTGDPHALAPRLREAIYSVDPQQAVSAVHTMREVVSERLSAPQLTWRLTGLLALLTLLITVAGIGGVAAASAASRKTEIGIRMALGAMPRQLVARMVCQELAMVFFGLTCGLAAGIAFTRVLGRILYETEPHDPVALAAAVSLMLVAAGTACLLPAVRAVRVDPLETLRSE